MLFINISSSILPGVITRTQIIFQIRPISLIKHVASFFFNEGDKGGGVSLIEKMLTNKNHFFSFKNSLNFCEIHLSYFKFIANIIRVPSVLPVFY